MAKKTAKKPAKKASKKSPAKKPVKVVAKKPTKARVAKKAPNPQQKPKPPGLTHVDPNAGIAPGVQPMAPADFGAAFRSIMFPKPKRSAASLLGDDEPPKEPKQIAGDVLREAIAEYRAGPVPGAVQRVALKYGLNIGAFSISLILSEPGMVENRAATIAYLMALGVE